MENKMNWGTLILGIVIGAVVVSIVWLASKPSTTLGISEVAICDNQLNGVITFINKAENVGKIAAKNGEYPFRIPEDVTTKLTITKGMNVLFSTVGIGSDCSSKRVTNVRPAEIFKLSVPSYGFIPGGSLQVSPSAIQCPVEEFQEGVETLCYYSGTEVTLTAVPKDDYSFGQWYGDCFGTTSSTCIITMDSDKRVTASFSLNR